MEKLPVTNDRKLNLSPAALHKVLVLPIVVMVVTINVVFAISWYFERRTQEDALPGHIITVLNGHSTYLSREIFFDRASAVTGRLSEIVKSKMWNPDGLPARLCLHLVFDPEFNRRGSESICSDDAPAILPATSLSALPGIALEVGDRHAADVRYDLALKSQVGGFIPPNLLWPMILGIVAAALSYLMLFRRLNINLIQPAHQRIVKNEKLAAIAQFVQMIAHDIRAPLSLLRTIIKDLDASEIKSQTKADLLTVVDKKLSQVNNMLSDVMAIGPINPKSDSVSPTEMIAVAVYNVASLRQRPGVTFSYQLKHAKRVAAEESKVIRVLGNIIDNAMQAVNDQGSIWIETRDSGGDGQIEFCIGNTGSYVTAEDREKVFEAFFTKYKSGGTGLGLASAKTIVDAYGGKIWCDSNTDRGTSFFFTFPAHETTDNRVAVSLPNTSEEATGIKIPPRTQSPVVVSAPHRPLKVLLVDDEPVYTQSLAAMIDSYLHLNGKVQVKTSRSVNEAIEIAESLVPDLVITDIDFGPNQPDGFTLIRELSTRFPAVTVAAYTNRTGDDFKAAVLQAGASAFITKPITDTALVSLLNEVAKKVASETHSKAQVVFVDDELVFYKHWSKRLQNIQFHYFSSPENLWNRLDVDPAFIQRIDAILTDFKFSSDSKESGAHVAKRIKSLCDKPVYLISNYLEDELGDRLDRNLFAGIFSKDDVPTEDEFRKKTQLA